MRKKAIVKINKEKMNKELDDLLKRCILNHKNNPTTQFGPMHSYSYASINIIAKYTWRIVKRKKVKNDPHSKS